MANVAVIRDTCPSSAGAKTYSVSGFGTPQAAIIIYTGCSSGFNPDNRDALISMGFTDGSTHTVSNAYSNSGVGTSQTLRRGLYTSDIIVLSNEPTGNSIIGRFLNWVQDGININFTVVIEPVEDYITIILLNGLTNVDVDYKVLSTGVNDFTTLGFKPDCVLLTSVAAPSTASISEAVFSFGAAHNNSSDIVSQAQIAWHSENGQASSNVSGASRNDSCVGEMARAVQAWKASAQDFDANGFSLNTGTDDPQGDYITYLAIKLDNPDDADVRIIDTPVTTGVQSYSSGFQPKFIMLGQSFQAAINTPTFQDTGIAVGSADNNQQSSHGLCDRHNQSTTNGQSNVDLSEVAQLYSEPSTKQHQANLQGFTASGYDLNFTATNTTARKWMSITIKSDAAPVIGENPLFFGTNF